MIPPICECIKFDLEFQKNILRFGYGINYKYEGMLTILSIDFISSQNSYCPQ